MLNNETFRKNLGFYTEGGKYNILAQLLSDDSHFPIRVAVFSGRTKADKLFLLKSSVTSVCFSPSITFSIMGMR